MNTKKTLSINKKYIFEYIKNLCETQTELNLTCLLENYCNKNEKNKIDACLLLLQDNRYYEKQYEAFEHYFENKDLVLCFDVNDKLDFYLYEMVKNIHQNKVIIV